MIKLDYLKDQYAIAKSAHEAAKKQVAVDAAVLAESQKNLNELDGRLILIRVLMARCKEKEAVPVVVEKAGRVKRRFGFQGLKNGSQPR